MGRERYGVRSTEMEYREGRRSYGGREREIASVEEGANSSCHQQTEAAPLSTHPAQRGSSEGVVLLRTPYSVLCTVCWQSKPKLPSLPTRYQRHCKQAFAAADWIYGEY
jgi:hypothetical protein